MPGVVWAPLRAPDDGGGNAGSDISGGGQDISGHQADHSAPDRDHQATDKSAEGAQGGQGQGQGGEKGRSASSLLSRGRSPANEGDQGSNKAGDQGAERPKHFVPPEGLPENLRGQNAEETLANVAQAYIGMRTELAKKHGQPRPPESPDKYKLDLPEAVKGKVDFDTEFNQPVLDGLREAAHKGGLSQSQFNDFLGTFMEGAVKDGLLDGPVDTDAELAELGGGNSVQGKAIVEELATWGDGLKRRGILNEDDHRAFEAMAADAASVRVINLLRGMIGERPMPIDPGAARGGRTIAEIKADLAVAMKHGNTPKGKQEKDRLMAELATATGQK